MSKEILEFIKNIPVALVYGKLIINSDNSVQWRIEFANEKSTELFKLRKEEVLGSDFLQIIPNLKNDNLFIEFLSSEDDTYSNYITIIKDNIKVSKQWIGDNYCILYFNKIIKSITSSDYVEKISEAIKHSVPDHIYYRDLNGMYLDCNESFLRDLNLERKDVIGKTNKEIKPLSAIHDKIMKTDKEAIEQKVKKIYIEEFVVNGKVKFVETTKTPFFDSYGNAIGIVGITRDVSHRSELERLRLEFFSNLSHELRTPLNLIFSSLQVAKVLERETLENNERLNKYIEIINQNANRLLKLVNNLIDCTKLECEYYKNNAKNDEIVRFIENIAIASAEFAKVNNISLIFDTDIEEKVMAFDAEKLERIMLNLLSNSIKFNKNYGQVEVLLEDKGSEFYIIVKDTGIGIPKDKLKTLFEKFKQVEDRLIKSNEGSGIGLALTKSLVELQGGTIEMKSELGVGTEVIVKLPVRIASETIEPKEIYNVDYNDDLLARMNVEFSDIYHHNS